MKDPNKDISPITTEDNPAALRVEQLSSGAAESPAPQAARPEKQRSGWKKAFNILGNVLFACLLFLMVALVASMVQSRIRGGPPQVAGHQMFIVLSGSMSPAFDAGSLAFVKPTPAQTIAEGDIITFRSAGGGDTLTTHRVVQVNREGGLSFTTRGDANQVNDPAPVPAGNLVGKVKLALPYAGYIMDFGQSKTGIILMVMIPGALIIIFELRNLFRLAGEYEAARKAEKKKENSVLPGNTESHS